MQNVEFRIRNGVCEGCGIWGASGSKKPNSLEPRIDESVVPEAGVSLHCDVTLHKMVA